ncbi:hypothetical protein [Chryseobacterium phosphatilyticum]|nr:hypothetical protein [Chryseobacterium phosphatilyticum]
MIAEKKLKEKTYKDALISQNMGEFEASNQAESYYTNNFDKID